MKQAASLLVLIFFTTTAFAQTWIKSTDAIKYKGDLVNVVGLVSKLNIIKEGNLPGTYVTLSGTDAKPLNLIILKKDEERFRKITGRLLDNYVQVRGRVAIKNGTPYILLSSTNQIRFATDGPDFGKEPT